MKLLNVLPLSKLISALFSLPKTKLKIVEIIAESISEINIVKLFKANIVQKIFANRPKIKIEAKQLNIFEYILSTGKIFEITFANKQELHASQIKNNGKAK